MASFAADLKKARQEKGYTMWELSKQVDMLVSEVEHLERGMRMPSTEELNKLTRVLGGDLRHCQN